VLWPVEERRLGLRPWLPTHLKTNYPTHHFFSRVPPRRHTLHRSHVPPDAVGPCSLPERSTRGWTRPTVGSSSLPPFLSLSLVGGIR
jgi:hypothetical protein